MLNFELLPRLKGIGRQKLYRPEAGNSQAYPNLQLVLSRPINWELIKKYYDEIVKYTIALKLGTADAEAILSRFTKNGVKHPAYQAVLELGKVRKTIFLCKYLRSEALRQEIEEGLRERPLGVGVQEQASNHPKLHGPKVRVVSVRGKAQCDCVRYRLRRRAQANHR
jgi:TnpA family transposase